jgi:3'-phosphoadenosine 5'-phosphosulfate sulfotransferase (PAPS reductase)/FAD synthetase
MNLLAQIQTETVDYSGLKVLLPLSGGINSAALLCWLIKEIPDEKKPLELHLNYSHFSEHSDDTKPFVHALRDYAFENYPRRESVFYIEKDNSVNDFFRKSKMIPHPSISPCSRELKVKPRRFYFEQNNLDIELIGYINSDIKRFRNLSARNNVAAFPILEWSKQDCLTYVKNVIGWYPTIYDIKENGKDVFSHNNCLPCKNMHPKQLQMVAKYFPEKARIAEETARMIPDAYWGREDVPEVFKCDVCERMS